MRLLEVKTSVEQATTDLATAVDGADVVIVISGGHTHATVARSLAPLLRNRQVLVLSRGILGAR